MAENTSTRKWWVFLLLQVLGFVGYVYIGKPKRFLIVWGISLVVLIVYVHGLSGVMAAPKGILSAYLALLLIWCFVIIDSTIIALRLRKQKYELRRYNKWFVYTLLVLIGWLPSFILKDLGLIGQVGVRTFSIPASSMIPTLKVGDYISADMRIYQSTDPVRGDVVIFNPSFAPNIDYVKRIMGLPGEAIQVTSGVVYINGIPVERAGEGTHLVEPNFKVPVFRETLHSKKSFLTLDINPTSIADNTKVFEVPDGHYFVMGDNRDNSADSRFNVGFVPRANITGKAIGIYYSPEWGRIGTRFD